PLPPPPASPPFPYTTLFRSWHLPRRRPGVAITGAESDASGRVAPRARRATPPGPPARSRERGLAGRSCKCRSGNALHIAHNLTRSEEHTSELQSRFDLVCRL